MNDLYDHRREYLQGSLRRSELNHDPYAQFKSWFDETLASDGYIDASSMVLSTVSAQLQPSSRIVLLKSYDSDGFVFFTSYLSRKAKDIEANPKVCLSFTWNHQERQIHIEGEAVKVSPEVSESYFKTRPLDSQRAALLAPQSSVIEGKQSLYDEFAKTEGATSIDRPDYWGGYRVKATSMEFWQGGPARIHDRFRYTSHANEWFIERLAP